MTRILLCTILLFSLVGCGTSDETLTLSKGSTFWNTYINRPVNVDITNPKKLDEWEIVMADRIAPLDSQITGLERILDSISDPSNEEQIKQIIQKFPWVTAVYLLDIDGSVLASMPAYTMKMIDFSYLNTKEVEPRKIYASVLESSYGNEILLARPYVQDGKAVGFIGASFDMRALLAYVDTYNNDTKRLIITSPDSLIWSNDIYYSDSGLPALDGESWQKIIDKGSLGFVTANGKDKSWIVRYLGDLPIIFVVPDDFG